MKPIVRYLPALVMVVGLTSHAKANLSAYSQNFEGLNAFSSTALSADGWLVFGVDNVGSYGPFPAPNGGQAFSSIASGAGGPNQGTQYLNVYSDYGNPAHNSGNFVNALVFRQQTVGTGDVGTTVSLSFDYRANPSNNNNGNTTTFAFIKVLKQSDASFDELGIIEFDTTNAADWQTQSIDLAIAPGWAGELLQFGFRSLTTSFFDSGRFYDNISFSVDSSGNTVTVDPSETWLGYMNVFEINRTTTPPSQAGFVFGSPWGFADLVASFDANNCLTLSVNSVDDPNPFWYLPSGGPGSQGNKWMDANAYVEKTNDPNYSGVSLTFEGTVKSNTFTANHTARAFIRDFAPDYSSFQEASVLLTSDNFSITLSTIAAPGRHVQYGFNVQGENVWITDAAAFGTVVVGGASAPPVALVGNGIFHNGFGGGGTPPWNAIDNVKSLALRGPTPVELTYDHLINTSRGLNGVVLDFDGLGDLNDLVFAFQWSGQNLAANSDIDNWLAAPSPNSTTLHVGQGVSGSDRVQILWENNAIVNRFLRINVTTPGGSTVAELFAGHLLGETGGPSEGLYTITFGDITPIRAAVGQTVDAGSLADIDKNGTVTFADISLMRGSVGAQLNNIILPAMGP